MGNPKDKEHSDAEATGEAGESVTAREIHKPCQANRDLSHERPATIDKLVVEAIRQPPCPKSHHYEETEDLLGPDPRDLNEALEREPYHTHSIDEITANLKV